MHNINNIITKENFDAVLFDMDGVLTVTATVHAKCWKRMFDQFLEGYSEKNNQPFIPFDEDRDYKLYVDGKPRNDGVRSFLESRGITLPEGNSESIPDNSTISGLANWKNICVNNVFRTKGVDVYEGSLRYVLHIRSLEIKTAVVTSSKNCDEILKTAGINELFDARVDGTVSSELNLSGKPDPDIFLEAAKKLGVSPKRSVVIEDAISGVQAGKNGGFGLVIGVNRDGDPELLSKNGADIVVNDLGELLSRKYME
ncbi:MAG: beta-phosphoglucomutase family hydrolase [bacterium]